MGTVFIISCIICFISFILIIISTKQSSLLYIMEEDHIGHMMLFIFLLILIFSVSALLVEITGIWWLIIHIQWI
jgi:hypothetical protein